MTIRAPLITRIERRPPPLHEVTGFSRLQNLLKSQDKQFGGAGQWKAYDWPNPILRADSLYLASYLRQREGSSPNPTLYKGLDKQFAGPGQWKSYDYPNPRGYEYPISLRTWVDSLKVNLRFQDKQFAGFGQWKSYDYPNPLIPGRANSLLTWTQSLNQTTLTAVAAPFRPIDWIVPRGYSRNESLGWVNQVIRTQVQSPFNPRDWPIPLGAKFPTDLLTWISQTKLNLIGKDQFFYGARGPVYDYPNPRGYEFSIQLRTIAQGFTMLDLIPPAVIIIPPVVVPPVPPGGTSHKKRYRRLKKLKERKIPEPQEVIVELTEPVEHQTLEQVLTDMRKAGFDIKEQEEEDDMLVLTFILKSLH